MPVNFSTITPMSQATISKMPAYTNVQQNVASSPMTASEQPKKKSHWFAKTLLFAAVVLGAAAALRGKVDVFKNFDKSGALADGAKFMEKAAHYGKKAVAVVGDFVIENGTKAYNFCVEKGSNLFKTVKGWFNKGGTAA